MIHFIAVMMQTVTGDGVQAFGKDAISVRGQGWLRLVCDARFNLLTLRDKALAIRGLAI
jgi:hypothetical protein